MRSIYEGPLRAALLCISSYLASCFLGLHIVYSEQWPDRLFETQDFSTKSNPLQVQALNGLIDTRLGSDNPSQIPHTIAMVLL